MSSREIPAPVVQAVIDREVEPDEVVVWAGQPRGWALARHSLGVAGFGVFVTAFMVFWVASAAGAAMQSSVGLIFSLFGVPGILVGVGMMAWPLVERRHAGRTVYVLTDRRAIVVRARALGGERVRTFTPAHLWRMERIERGGGRGDLVFERERGAASYGEGPNAPSAWMNLHGFVGIDDVLEVERLVRRTLLDSEP